MPNFSLPDAVFLEAAHRFPTPFYLYDRQGMADAVRALKRAFAWNAGYREYYAVKALPNPHILKLLMDGGCGLDCSSECELLLARRLRARGGAVMFSANAMPTHELALARGMGAYINLDDISDIGPLASLGALPATVSLRFNPGGSFHGDGRIMGAPGEAKYGFTLPQLREGLGRLKALGVSGFGLHALLASNTLAAQYYPRLAGLLLRTAAALEAETGVRLRFINLSGGIGIPYRPEEKAVDIASVGESVRRAYQAVLGPRADVAVFTELGRFVTGPHGYLVTRAVHEKDTYKRYLGVDACAANLLRPAMYGAYHHISVCGKRAAPHDTLYDVTGALCENNDKFAVDRLLPKVEPGDVLVIHDAGAHAHAMGYQYNGRLRSAEYLYRGEGDYAMIRRAETPGDYFATIVGEI